MATKPKARAQGRAPDSYGVQRDALELIGSAINVAYYEWSPASDDAFHFSPALLNLFGYDPAIRTRQLFWESVHNDDQPAYHAARIAYLEGSSDRAEFTYRARMASGEYRWLRDQTTVERDAAGRVTRLVGALSDITEARQRNLDLQAANQALADREAESRALIARQAASVEVLKTISASPDDPQPVFDLIARRARELCKAARASVTEYDGALLHMRARDGYDPATAEFGDLSWPQAPDVDSVHGRVTLSGGIVHVRDVSSDSAYGERSREVKDRLGSRSLLGVPLLREGQVVGSIVLDRAEVGGFDASEVAVVEAFAEQAVIAIASATTLGELRTRTAQLATRNSEYGLRIEQQTATIEVLKAMSNSPDDTQPVFDLIARHAAELCESRAALWQFDGTVMQMRASFGTDREKVSALARPFPRAPDSSTVAGRSILERQVVHVRDVSADPKISQVARDLGGNSIVAIPLLRDMQAIGAIALNGNPSGGFSDSQIALLQTFAEQAVIAITSVANFRALRQRTAELMDALETQSATADVLKAISRAAYDLDTVLSMLITTALRLCNSAHGQIWRRDGEIYRYLASLGNVPAYREMEEHTEIRAGRGTLVGRVALEGRTVQIADAWNDPDYADKEAARMGQARSMLGVPLLRDGEMIGAFALARTDLVPFTDREVELVTTFADQAVIAIENVRLFDEVQTRTAALARSVAELQALEEVLRAVNSSLDLETVLATIISRAVQLSQADEGTIYEFDDVEQVFVPKAAFGMSSERVEALRERKVKVGEAHLGRAAVLRAPVHIDDVQQDSTLVDVGWLLQGIHAVLAVPLLRDDKVIGGLVIRRRTAGGFAPTIPTLLQTFAGQSVLAIENARLFQELAARGEEARRARTAAEVALTDLRRAQDRLVQSEKMASLGQLTAGIAHEIKNPLNFVNNFSDLSIDLLDELHDAVAPDKLTIAADLRAEIDELTTTLKGNLAKIAQHGRRADSIVKNMLLHSRSGPSEHRAIDLNTIVEEALNLAYHGARAETPGFNITLEKELDSAAGTVDLFPQEFTRVMLNLIANGFYAAHRRAEETTDKAFEPTLRLTTHDLGEHVEIRVRDNGTGISDAVRDKIFEPFFTTKPAGAGTGLGLSLSYDIVVKQHGGQLAVDSQIGAFTEFTITLPRLMTTTEGGTQ
jgi:two-component system, NtrC family, sensor kinase